MIVVAGLSQTTERLRAWVIKQSPQALGRLVEYGTRLLKAEVEARLALAERKIQAFERKYGTTLIQLRREGLPPDASMEMHEDYVEWSGWQRTRELYAEIAAEDMALAEAHLPLAVETLPPYHPPAEEEGTNS